MEKTLAPKEPVQNSLEFSVIQHGEITRRNQYYPVVGTVWPQFETLHARTH